MGSDTEKIKLTVDEQILDMKKKGDKFELCTEQEAKRFLNYNNY